MLRANLFNFSHINIYLVIILSLFNSLILFLINTNLYKELQLNNYSLKRMFTSLKNKKFMHFQTLFMNTFLSFATMTVLNILIINLTKIVELTYLSLIFYVMFAYIQINYNKHELSKNKLVYTKRMKRLIIPNMILDSALTFGLLYLSFNLLDFAFVSIISLMPFLSIFTFILSEILIWPEEYFIQLYFKNKAKKKLKNFKDLKIIAITGSYAKTSVKNILFTLLSEKYNVEKTPNSFNTEMGICKVINDHLNESAEYLILEFGADKKHDIKKLTDIAMPDISILTGINNQHLKTFKTMGNIISTKYELIENTKTDGITIFNGDNEIVKGLYAITHRKNKFLVGLEEYVSDIKIGSDGTSFNLKLEGAPLKLKTKLLGKHNVLNITLCAVLCYKLGLSLKEIASGVSKLEPTGHRLELIESNGLNIIDDSFNSNVLGAQNALEVLKEFSGNKIVVTPGLVELGNDQEFENIKLANTIATSCDYVIVVNETNKKAFEIGLQNLNDSQKYFVSNLLEAQTILEGICEPGDTVLFLNDLPDNYA